MSESYVKVEVRPYRLKFRFPFRIAHGTRTGTDALLVKVSLGDKVGFGEASFPPYLIPTQASSMQFFAHPLVQSLSPEESPQEIFEKLQHEIAGEMPAKAALDMALWQLHGLDPEQFLGPKRNTLTPHTYTLGISSLDEMKSKMHFAQSNGYSFFKIKLNGESDKEMIDQFRTLSDAPFAVDANQAWTSLGQAKEMAVFLEDQGAVLIEQPFSKDAWSLSSELKSFTRLPVVADESCQMAGDVRALSNCFSGINIKLHKCGGLSPAVNMIREARELQMKVLVGCMSEGPVGCAAGELLAPWADWADLDGVLLNEPVAAAASFF
jgi:L-alanine-DL-glutamate epimerase-like enolase superfamily enzyme